MSEKRYIWILVIAILTIFFVNLDAIYVNIMEARNFTTAREMLHDGNWLLTTLNGEPRYEKPPLPTWLTAISAALFGIKNLIALRLPAAIITLVLILFSYKFSLRLTQNKMWALVSSLIMATSFYIIFAGRNGQWDIFTHGFMMGCIYFLYRFFTEERNKYTFSLVAALFFGCSFMSKGPVSFYALLLPFLISYGIVFKYKGLRSRTIPLIVFLIVGLILSGWWHWYTYTYDPVAVAEITEKETSNWTGYNVRPFYYYWSFFTQSGVWTIPAFVGLLYPYLKNRVFDKKAYLFTFLWTLISVVLLSIIPEKKSRYLLPVLIPLALNTGFYIEYLFRSFDSLKDPRESLPVYFNFGLIGFIALIFPVAGYFYLNEQLSGNWIWFSLLSISLLLIGFFMFRNLFRKHIRPVFFLTIAFIIAVMCFGMPLAKTLTVNNGYKSLAELNSWQAEENVTVYEFTYFTPELIWAYGKPLEVLSKGGNIKIPEEEKFGVLVAAEDLPLFEETFSEFNRKKVVRYDMNAKGEKDASHKTRLYRDLYLVTKSSE
ncbi:ArnT family glycosyltransferase [Constantimarinum furrinae]|uniref:Dolichyl-phosphate-mannose-protein mannosyltransferase n=1 Tax=Constantimarinum furrinae TaxID=2562285 RepID=A0A7G8PQY5_9FLAO|nr:glycosyltransferase family 39 protein [Constantimarinum furrinae]QNJ96751.1 Dolichyl-phosphate-mannose-protein mannosyltransferase [Constantimarinum furrinae]